MQPHALERYILNAHGGLRQIEKIGRCFTADQRNSKRRASAEFEYAASRNQFFHVSAISVEAFPRLIEPTHCAAPARGMHGKCVLFPALKPLD